MGTPDLKNLKIRLNGLIDLFEYRVTAPGWASVWKGCPPATFVKKLRERANRVEGTSGLVVQQGSGSYLCGTAVVVQQLMRTAPEHLLQFAMSLYECGQASLCVPSAKGESKVIRPTEVVTSFNLDAPTSQAFVPKPTPAEDPKAAPFGWLDWILLGSIRSQIRGDWFDGLLTFKKPVYEEDWRNVLGASATAGEVKELIQLFGYSEITSDTWSISKAALPPAEDLLKRLVSPFPSSDDVARQIEAAVKRTQEALKKVNDLLASPRGYKVSLFINSYITRKYGLKQANPEGGEKIMPTHWIALSSPIEFAPEKKKGVIRFRYIDYGSEKLGDAKKGVEFPLAEFSTYFFGYIAIAP